MKRTYLYTITDTDENKSCEFNPAIKKTNYYRMKKYLLILSIFSCTFSFGQEKLGQSIELQESSIYYFVGDKYLKNYDEYTNFYNYGLTLLYSAEIIKNLSCSIGINYSTKNYYSETFPNEYNSEYERWEDYLKYINIPLFLNYRFAHTKAFEFKFTQGFYINYRADHDIRRLFKDKPMIEINNQDDFGPKYNTGLTYRCSTILSYVLNSEFNINLIPFFDYKFWMGKRSFWDPVNQSGWDPVNSLTEDRVSCGASIGFEYKF